MARESAIAKSRLFALYSCLTPAEVQHFHVQPTFSRPIDRHQLSIPQFFSLFHGYLLERTANGQEPGTLADLWHHCFPGTPPDHGFLRKKFFQLTNELKDFLAKSALEREAGLKNLLLIRELNRRNEGNNLRAEIRKFERQIEKKAQWSADDHFIAHSTLIEAHDVAVKQGNRGSKALLEALIHHLDQFFHHAMAKYYCQWENYQRVLKSETSFSGKETWHQFLESQQEGLPPAAQIYFALSQILSDPGGISEEQLDRLLADFFDISESIDEDDRWNLFNHFSNYYIQMINLGQEKYVVKLDELNSVALEKGLLFRGDLLPGWTYKNMVSIKLKRHRIDGYALPEIREFIEGYKNRISATHRENIYKYCLAYYHFVGREFRQAQRLLFREIERGDEYLKPDSYWLLLKCYYELNDQLLLHDRIESFRGYLRRTKHLPPERVKIHLFRLGLFNRLAKVKDKPRMAKVLQLKSEVGNSPALNDRGWFFEKLEELELGVS